MSSVDINEIYEKLLQIYEARYDYTNPKAMLHYRINELVREGKTKEDAILTLYEKEGELTRAEKEKVKGVIRKKKAEEAVPGFPRGLLAGVVAYVRVKGEDREVALLALGIIMTFIGIVGIWVNPYIGLYILLVPLVAFATLLYVKKRKRDTEINS